MQILAIVLSLLKADREFFIFFFNDTATTEIYTLSLHDALPICFRASEPLSAMTATSTRLIEPLQTKSKLSTKRSEEHTSELQSPCNLVCRLLLEKKKKTIKPSYDVLATYSSYVLNIHYLVTL